MALSSQLSRNPPFRAEHLGSLLRPEFLLNKRDALDLGKTTADELDIVAGKAIRQAVEAQEACGFHAVTDGEYRYVFSRSNNSRGTFPPC